MAKKNRLFPERADSADARKKAGFFPLIFFGIDTNSFFVLWNYFIILIDFWLVAD